MFWVVAAVLAGFPPGAVRNVSQYAGIECANATIHLPLEFIDTDHFCFSTEDYSPSLNCRIDDAECEGTGQAVVSDLAVNSMGYCTTYEWTWVCAGEARVECGTHWCDPLSQCVLDDYCACPQNMTGDPHWESCLCPAGHLRNGDICELLPVCAPENTTACPEKTVISDNIDGIAVEIFVVVIVAAMLCSAAVGFLAGRHDNVDNEVAPLPAAPIRHMTNQMYESAGNVA